MSIDKMVDRFRENLEKYKRMGLNPLSLATGCAVKVDLIDTVYPAISKIRPALEKLNIEITPREDADIFISRKLTTRKRIINSGEFDADRAVALIQVNQNTASSPEKFGEFLLRVYTSIKTNRKLTIGKGHSIVTTNPKGEVAVLDLFKLDGDKENSYTVTNNDTIQIVDPLDDPGSQVQVDVAISNSLNDLFTKGVFQDIKIVPVVDAPLEELRTKLLENYKVFSEKYSFEMENDIQPKVGTLMIGATVIGKSDHELPTFYNNVNEKMEILVTRPVGELTPINLSMWILAVPELVEELEKRGITIKRVEDAKRKALDYMKKPNIDVAKTIYNYLPPFGKQFDEKSHIAITTDVTGPGLFVVKEFAKKANVDVEITDIPVIDSDIHEFSTENFIIPNSTAGTNGAIVIFAHNDVINQLYEDLKKIGQEPRVIGKVIRRGDGIVYAPQIVTKYIHRANVLKEFKLK
ncbi:SelD-related putative sulfur metabolism protein [Sulfolobus acidocaldarius]|uniref:Conserved Archaeal protein n=4 Tax=Sulfolobus acidocaldarius TaxID=2285 RepID=Q4J6M7_SULAC|nr:SelD-related putative sulfur metabolism protein [Sulfolobus acidocaldarius]AAY81554.1 conserved Archaeal protein [Sulfolobus acidocaldarius DSM 639]AGE72157.1 hypothetical protein SacN8_11055 [Sulfolobus acidocaldarius N8]AGE74474.1 hypothetical protein SacRon12I_11300 [Sulfolobus acidocaldarius Ron12/I]ALU29671.1 selenophosphate synthetase [Sulfolobus acidocaldarius]ALU32406.1 selenophosphate synthetase [Sulfolobus acidocaldarius]